jgi:hypothetical protein
MVSDAFKTFKFQEIRKGKKFNEKTGCRWSIRSFSSYTSLKIFASGDLFDPHADFIDQILLNLIGLFQCLEAF